MRPNPETITLGDKSWVVRPLTVAQVQAIEEIMLRPDWATRGAADANIELLRVALSRDFPQDAGTDLSQIEASLPEIRLVMPAVFRLMGIMKTQETTLGEAEAPAQTGAGSEAA